MSETNKGDSHCASTPGQIPVSPDAAKTNSEQMAVPGIVALLASDPVPWLIAPEWIAQNLNGTIWGDISTSSRRADRGWSMELWAPQANGAYRRADESSLAAGRFANPSPPRSIAVLPLQGPITYRPTLLSAIFGGTPLMDFQAAFQALVADPDIAGIVIDADSPGGPVSQVPETADMIYRARRTKPVTTVIPEWLTSAGYYIGAAADKVLMASSAYTGSIGVVSVHVDSSEALEKAGQQVTLVYRPDHKVDANPVQPLGEEARADIEARHAQIYDQMTSDIGRYRGMRQAGVHAKFGQGRVLNAQQAMDAGMVDGIGSLGDAIAVMAKQTKAKAQVAVAAAVRDEELSALEAECLAAGAPDLSIPANPPNGSGSGAEGDWSPPTLSDFTDEQWEDLPAAERRRISSHFAWITDLETFGAFSLPHHFPPNHSDSGKASVAGVRAALSRSNQVGSLPAAELKRVRAHLRAHLPERED